MAGWTQKGQGRASDSKIWVLHSRNCPHCCLPACLLPGDPARPSEELGSLKFKESQLIWAAAGTFGGHRREAHQSAFSERKGEGAEGRLRCRGQDAGSWLGGCLCPICQGLSRGRVSEARGWEGSPSDRVPRRDKSFCPGRVRGEGGAAHLTPPPPVPPPIPSGGAGYCTSGQEEMAGEQGCAAALGWPRQRGSQET